MIIDITGAVLIPGNRGIDCPGNGTRRDIECCCDECDYLQCCLDTGEIPAKEKGAAVEGKFCSSPLRYLLTLRPRFSTL